MMKENRTAPAAGSRENELLRKKMLEYGLTFPDTTIITPRFCETPSFVNTYVESNVHPSEAMPP